jgi:Na+/H+ antiporter NhaD/arsenite permease-like protein
MLLLSLKFTTQKVRASNHFSWEPIVEVAYLFLGIFITMVPCLIYLETHAETLGINTPTLFYYATGGLSSFLDNTPTAVTFHSLALGLSQGYTGVLVAGIPESLLRAISISAVLFGSMTYIGNGPNFMVKAIAESQGIDMPDFFAYIYKFALIVLLPIFVLIQLIFI